MSFTNESPKEENVSEAKIQGELVSIINAVVSNIKKVNDYPIPEYETPEFSFKSGINSALRQALKKYFSKKIQVFYSQF